MISRNTLIYSILTAFALYGLALLDPKKWPVKVERADYDQVLPLRGISVSESIKTLGTSQPQLQDTPGNVGIGITAPMHPFVFQAGATEILRIESNGDIFLRGKKIGHDDHIVRDLRQAFPGTEEKARWRALQETFDATGRRIYHIDPETGDLGIGTPPNREERNSQ